MRNIKTHKAKKVNSYINKNEKRLKYLYNIKQNLFWQRYLCVIVYERLYMYYAITLLQGLIFQSYTGKASMWCWRKTRATWQNKYIILSYYIQKLNIKASKQR